MKPIYLILIIYLSFLTPAYLKAQDKAASLNVTGDLVLEIPKADLIKTIPTLKLKLKEMKNISFDGFCESRKLLFLHTNSESLTDVLKIMNEMNLIYYIKQNTSIERAKKACMNEEEIKSSFIIE